MLFDTGLSPLNVGMKPVRYEVPKKQEGNSYMPAWNNQDRPRRPCPLCSIKGFEWDHYPLSWKCGVKKLSSMELIKTLEFVPAAAATITSTSIANLPSWTAPTGYALRTAPQLILCSIKGFESDHYPLSWKCGVKTQLCGNYQNHG